MTERTQSPYFVRQWGARCVVASVRDGQRLSIRKSSVAYCVLRPLVFIGVVKLLFVLACWPPASLFGPSILSHSAPSVSWGAPGQFNSIQFNSLYIYIGVRSRKIK